LTFANRMGVPFDYAAIANEPDNSRNLLTLTSAQAAEVYSELARIIHARGLRTKLVLGDDTGWPSTLSYAKAELGAPGVHASTAVVASHSYYGTSNDRAALARFAHQAGLGVWQTEWTSNCSTCNGRGPAATEQMLDWSKQITAALVEADARAWFTFEAVADGGTGALITRQQQSQVPFAPTKRFYLLEQYTHAAPPGSQRLAVKQRGRQDAISAVAFRSDSGESVVLTNYAATDETISLDLGKSSGRITARRTAQSDNFRPLPPATYRGRPLRVTLPKQSITTLFLTT
jgi:O-glycosyl hydrolase